MNQYFGVAFALAALFSWGFGDYFIQKTARAVGIWKALFFIGVMGMVALYPFVRNQIFRLELINWQLLVLLGMVVVFAALFDFEALKEGKMAIVEPILAIELPITVGLSLTLAGERLNTNQLILIGLIFVGILLTITTQFKHLHYHKRIFEKGVIMAGLGAIGMALTNFLVGISSQQTSPLLTIWFTHSLVAVVCFFYLWWRGDIFNLWQDIKNNPLAIFFQSAFDNIAWLSYAFATTLIPISIAMAISESYIALAVLLGIFLNKEKLRRHQLIGVAIVILCVIFLSISG